MSRLPAEQRRSALVAAAIVVIARDGVHAATTRAIVAEAGMPLASFHYVFRSRDELIRAVIDTVVHDEQQASWAHIVSGGCIREMLRGGLQAYFDLLEADASREQAMFELIHYAMRTPELTGLAAVQHGSYLRAAEGLLAAGAEAADIRWSIDVVDLARVLIAFVDGLTLAWLADRNSVAAGRLMDHAADVVSGFAVPVTARVTSA